MVEDILRMGRESNFPRLFSGHAFSFFFLIFVSLFLLYIHYHDIAKTKCPGRLLSIRVLSSDGHNGLIGSLRSLLRRHSFGSSRNLPLLRTSAEAKGTFLSLCLRAFRSRLRALDPEKNNDHVRTRALVGRICFIKPWLECWKPAEGLLETGGMIAKRQTTRVPFIECAHSGKKKC